MVQDDKIALNDLAPGASLMPNQVWGGWGVDVAKRGVAIARPLSYLL